MTNDVVGNALGNRIVASDLPSGSRPFSRSLRFRTTYAAGAFLVGAPDFLGVFFKSCDCPKPSVLLRPLLSFCPLR